MTGISILNGETWLICGGRDFTDQAMFTEAMDRLVEMWGLPARVVHGACGNEPPYKGADAMADWWGHHYALDVGPVPANWGHLGRSAGPKRNWEMLTTYKPHRVIAFPGGKGTADMVAKARYKTCHAVVEIKKAEQ